jgi:hypothetical protein
MVHCKNWDRALQAVQDARGRIRNRPQRCRSRIFKTFWKMELRT